jgi:hypothetical protein
LFITGDSSNPLPTDFTEAYIGADIADNARMQGIVDDVAFFSTALAPELVTQLAGGALPSTLPASANLIAYWNFNDATSTGPGPRPTLTSIRSGAKITLTFTGALESTDTINGTWAPVQNATSPFDVNMSEAHRFYRATN